jgi:hypothetical protein
VKYIVEIEYEKDTSEMTVRFRGGGISNSDEDRKRLVQDLRDAAGLIEDPYYPIRRIDN